MDDLGAISKFVTRIERFRVHGPARRWIFAVAAAVFIVGFVVALGSIDLSLSQLEWPALLAAILVGVPSMSLANAGEYKVAGMIVGRDIGFGSALRVAVLSTAANLLPVPGGPLVKTKGLIDEGTRAGRALLVTALMAGAWLATSLLIAGLLGGLGLGAAVALAVAGSLVGIGVYGILVSRVLEDRKAAVVGAVAAVELAATLATGLRMWLVAQALGLDLGSGAFVLGVAPVLGAAVVFVPAGLGVRELVASLAAPAVGLSAASGFLISSVDRLAGMLVHGIAAAFFAVSSRHDQAPREAI